MCIWQDRTGRLHRWVDATGAKVRLHRLTACACRQLCADISAGANSAHALPTSFVLLVPLLAQATDYGLVFSAYQCGNATMVSLLGMKCQWGGCHPR